MIKIVHYLCSVLLAMVLSNSMLGQHAELFDAIESKDAVAFNQMVVNVSDYNLTNDQGYSLLAFCSEHGFNYGTAFLLSSGADVNKSSTEGVTPLMIASRNGFYSIVQLLLDNGANTQLRDMHSMNALDHCAEARWQEEPTSEVDHSNCFQILSALNN